MAAYLIIESRDPFAVQDVQATWSLATQLVKEQNDVTLLLIGSGVAAARKSGKSQALQEIAAAGVKVLADDFSLRERGIKQLAPGLSASPIDTVIDALAQGAKTLWR